MNCTVEVWWLSVRGWARGSGECEPEGDSIADLSGRLEGGGAAP